MIRNVFLSLAACCCLGQALTATTIELAQGGWEFGGPLELSFTGEDSDLDGWIEQQELDAFRAVYQLPDGGETTWLMSHIQVDGFRFFDVGNFLFFADNTNYTLIDSGFEGAVTASISDRFLFPIDLTESAPVIVPEPSGMILSGLAAIGAIAWLTRERTA
jgi:hypothetical protein